MTGFTKWVYTSFKKDETFLKGEEKPMEILKRIWSKLPDRASKELPEYYNLTPRLDAVRAIAEHSATQELKFYKKQDLRKNGKNAEVVIDSPLYELLDNPMPTFPDIDGYSLRYFTFAQLELVGECAWLKIRDRNKIYSLMPILKSWIEETPTANSPYYKIIPYGDINGNVLTVSQNDIVIFKDINIADPYGHGKGVAESIADEIESDEYASKYQKQFFFNDATPPFVVTGFSGNQEQADKVKKSLMSKMSGFFHAREPAVLTGGADIKTVGLAPKELDMVESRKYLRNECLQHFRLPPELMGIIENSNRSTIDASFYLLQKNILPSRLARFERALNRQLLPEFDKDLVCKHELVVEEDVEQKFKVYSFGLQNGTVTREEFRSAFGFTPEIQEGTLLVPFSVNIENATEEINLDEINNNVELPDDDDKNIKIFKKDEQEKTKIKAWELFDAKAIKNENAFITACQKIANKQFTEINEIIKNADLSKPIENEINLYFSKDVDQKTKSTLANAWIKCLNDGKENTRLVLGKKSVEEVDDVIFINEQFNKWIEKYGLEKSVLINDTTKKKLVKKLKSILAEEENLNLSEQQLKRKLLEGAKEVKEDLSEVRAKMIARTETGASINCGQVISAKQYGATKKEWIASYDDRTRDAHLYTSGLVVGIDESFDVGGEQLLYPLDPSGSPENVINCRCTVLTYIE